MQLERKEEERERRGRDTRLKDKSAKQTIESIFTRPGVLRVIVYASQCGGITKCGGVLTKREIPQFMTRDRGSDGMHGWRTKTPFT
jgi:hypothetical protein